MELKDLIENFCNEYDYEFRDDYSGRCMFGKTCIGIVGDNTMLICMQLVEYLNVEGYDDIVNKLGSPKTDNMGKSYIVYFPNFHE